MEVYVCVLVGLDGPTVGPQYSGSTILLWSRSWDVPTVGSPGSGL